jgi:electron transfer flavoprotein alpha subunit
MSTEEHLVWVLDDAVRDGTLERLGDARRVADRLSCKVGVLLVGRKQPESASLFERGADLVLEAVSEFAGPLTRAATALRVLLPLKPRLILAAGTPDGREWAARLAARAGFALLSPSLLAEVKRGELTVSVLDASGRYCRKVTVSPNDTAVVTLKPGVAEAIAPSPGRTGDLERCEPSVVEETLFVERTIAPDPRTVDIRHADRLVAGGRGLKDAEGFQALRRLAEPLRAGIAASRAAVDLGWIERERQVGQTGRTVAPELYVACGISGASHHLAGMSSARHIVAINTDPEAPIFRVAHLGLVADLYEVLHALDERISG